MTTTYSLEFGGFDIVLTLPALSAGQWVAVRANVALTAADVSNTAHVGTVRLTRTSTGYTVTTYNTAGTMLETMTRERDAGECLRVSMHNQAISLILDDAWLATVLVRTVRHSDQAAVYLLASGALTVTDIRLTELDEFHDEIWINIEDSGMNAIQAVLGQRKIKMWNIYDGTMRIAVSPTASTAAIAYAFNASRLHETPDGAASDALVVHDQTSAVLNLEALERIGWVTRAFRLADMEQGAIRAITQQIQEAAEYQNTVNFTTLPHPEIEVFDNAQIGLTDARALLGVDVLAVVRGHRLSITPGGAVSAITGIEYVNA